MPKRKVLQFINSFHQGGSERQAVQLTRLLKEDGEFEVYLACLSDEGVLRTEVENLGFSNIPEFKLTSFFNTNFLLQVNKCAKFIRKNNIEIIHTHDFYTNIFGMASAALGRVRVKIASKRETGSMRSRGQQIIEKIAFRQANGIVVNAEAVKTYLINEGVSANKINLVYNGLDLERLTPNETDRSKICQELGLPIEEKAKFITLVANLRHIVKNQPMFLRAARKVIANNPNAHFVLAGEGELRGDLENLAKELEISANIHFIGLYTKIPELLSISFACALTSFNEGFSNSILEYMVAEKPVVATKVGGASEAIIEGETGFLVESNDDNDLADKLIWLIDNPSQAIEIGKKGRKKIEENFSCEAQLTKTKNLYQKLLTR